MDGQNEFEWLKKYSTCFVVDSNNVKILKEPSEFYSILKVSYTEFQLLFFHKI